jgi:hypothetical protein
VRIAEGAIVAKAPDGTTYYRGLVTCGSVTACPCCAARVRQARAEEIEAALRQHLGHGGGAAFVTLTLPHDAAVPLRGLWTAISSTWRGLMSGRHRQGLRDLGVVGTIRAVDVTHGRHGWHPHLHVLLFLEAPAEIEELQALHRYLRERWSRRVVALGFREPGLYRGVRLLPVSAGDDVGGYLTKVGEADEPHQTPGLELARTDRKAGRAWGSRSPFAILADHHRHRRVSDRRLWEEWMLVSKGRRTLEWSRGLRAELLAEAPERTDEEIATETDPGTPVLLLAPVVWGQVIVGGLTVAVLVAAEAGSVRGVVDILEAAGIGLAVDVERGGQGPPRLSAPVSRCWGAA